MEAKQRTILFVYCGWCHCFLETKDGKGASGKSHGICATCAKKFRES